MANDRGHDFIDRMSTDRMGGYTRLLQFVTAFGVAFLSGWALLGITHHDANLDAMQQLIHQDHSLIEVMQERQERHSDQIKSVADTLAKVSEELIHVRERVICIENHRFCGGLVPD